MINNNENISLFRKEVWIMDPATDTYYNWLCTISIPVFYNLMFLVARSEFMEVLYTLSHILLNHYTLVSAYLTVVLSPCRACFNELQSKNTTLWMVLDYTSDVLYYIDTFVRARTGECWHLSNLSFQKSFNI